MATPQHLPAPPQPPPAPGPAACAPAPASAPAPGEPVAITIKEPPPPPEADRDCYVRNSSFLSRDIEARLSRRGERGAAAGASGADHPGKPKPSTQSPPRVTEPVAKVASPPPPVAKETVPSPPTVNARPPANKEVTPKAGVVSPPAEPKVAPKRENSVPPRVPRRETPVSREVLAKIEKLSLPVPEPEAPVDINEPAEVKDEAESSGSAKSEESNGVGDKIKKFEKAAEDASGSVGRLSRPGSMRGRPRTERLGSDNSREDLPPPATPFKDNVHFDLRPERPPTVLERQQSLTRNASAVARWQRTDSDTTEKPKPEPQKIIKPEFKPMASPADVTIRSPSLGAKLPEQFPSHGTAFRNVASPDPARPKNEDVNNHNNIKTCKFKPKEKYSVSKGSSYYTRGSEEIWLVKKKDIEEIEERVLDSFRRAGGNVCMRSESMRPASDSGQGASFSHATMGRNKRQMYARSESLDPQWAGARAQTLKRQTSVACTCGHDKKTRAKSAGPETTPRPRSRSHGDDNQAHVLDKYETLV